MGAPHGEITLSLIEQMKRQGMSQSEIARYFGVSRQAISWWKRTYNGSLTPRETALQAWPWKVPALMTYASPYKRLRDHCEYMATGGKGMSEGKLSRLRSFYRKLREENVVVEFSPDIPPEPGVSITGGFAYRKRRKSDGDLIIRVNQHTRMTQDAKDIFTFPLRDP